MPPPEPTLPLPLDHGHLQKLVTADLVRPDHLLGAHPMTESGVEGVRFAVWAPNAQHVSVVGDFNGWNGFLHPMERLDFGFWGAFVPGALQGQRYKFRVTGVGGQTVDKSDPYGTFFEVRPATASIIWQRSFEWTDGAWLSQRSQGFDRPVSIYECHVGSWARRDDGWFLNYRDLAHRLGEYLTYMGYTHAELLGVMEHPFDGSWGYQVTGYYAPTSRLGSPEDFKYLVNHLHGLGIGVILDWVPGHFPTDEFALAHFDGAPLYEYADPRKGYHFDWNTYIFDYGRSEVVMFLIGSALRWLQDFHIDGLRVDAVASMLYLDFSRTEWVPNVHGGRENLEAIAFLKRLNEVAHHMAPGCMVIAEESTSFPGITTPTPQGLGFDYKWAMGWMNDSLAYFAKDPLYRKYDHHKLTFFNVYRTSENYVLAISHDEVVHLKKPMILKHPGDWYAQRADYRAFLALMWTTPGKKLLFMGQDFAQTTEWNHDAPLPWHLADHPDHRGVMNLVRRLNTLYRERPDWHAGDTREEGMAWISADDTDHSVYAYARRDPRPPAEGGGAWSLVVANLTPSYREGYRIGVPQGGTYRVVLSTDDGEYGGFGTQQPDLSAEGEGLHSQAHSLTLNLPPSSVLVLEPVAAAPVTELRGAVTITPELAREARHSAQAVQVERAQHAGEPNAQLDLIASVPPARTAEAPAEELLSEGRPSPGGSAAPSGEEPTGPQEPR
ncbi:1,4-alpha-glucan branching enzyme [Deinococcus reticulitermitis]